MFPDQIDPAQQRQEIARLAAEASQMGEADGYTGKRKTIRYTFGMLLEAATSLNAPSDVFNVTMHDISEDGCSFWLRRKLESNTKLYVRAFSEDNSRTWLPVRVTHTTQTIQGFLIGVTFEAAMAVKSMSHPTAGRRRPSPPSPYSRPVLP